ncbi:DsrE family protein [Bacteroidota bacterium]
MKLRISLIAVLFLFLSSSNINPQDSGLTTDSTKLAVVWSSGDPDVAEKVCLMYTHAAKRAKWFDEVVLIVWGPSAKLLTENEKLQGKIKAMIKDGVKLQACIACARMYGDEVVNKLKDLGIEVKGMGVPLSNYLKDGWKTLTF